MPLPPFWASFIGDVHSLSAIVSEVPLELAVAIVIQIGFVLFSISAIDFFHEPNVPLIALVENVYVIPDGIVVGADAAL